MLNQQGPALQELAVGGENVTLPLQHVHACLVMSDSL